MLYSPAPADGKVFVGAAEAEVGPFVAAALAFDDANSLANRVMALADRLCGPVPRPISKSDQPAGPSAVLHALRSGSEQVRSSVREAHEALERIERFL